MRFQGLDLNLLVALDVLIEERSVSRAAERLHLSQPAMSAALRRLRDYFHDPILSAHGKKMIPTPHALRLRDALRALLTDVERMVSLSTQFDPATSQRRFRIGASDYLSIVLFTHLVSELEQVAPGVSLELVPPSDAMAAMLDQGELDLMITPAEHVSPDHPSELLFEERHVVAGWAGNPLVQRPLSEEDFLAAGHVAVEIGRLRPTSFAEKFLREQGKERRIEVLVSSFAVAPEMLVNTRRLAVMHERLARAYAERIAICFVEMPFGFPVMREMLQYNRTRSEDAGLRWLIALIKQVTDHS
ncbi:LysR family transcriptional regulator [Sphingomonas asaccharolytica]|uniref:LysR family transcriptional regulator n=1 Tax=Sphingomonas asaccharolytica TaxID=40681 RepID=UPI000833F4B8|nr:LysR family transcriptional regulator [Sphingomonas asaccharolytica]